MSNDRRQTGSRVTALLLVAATTALAPPTAGAAPKGATCRAGELGVTQGCVGRAAVARRVARITRGTMSRLGMKAAIVRVDTGRRPLITRAFGTSMAGVPARPDMHFRIGSMAIPHLITLLLQLEDEGRLSLDDKLARFLPRMPDAHRITLRMLANNTSGYRDWIQGNQAFVDLLLADVFKQWTPDELLAHAFARGSECDPAPVSPTPTPTTPC